MIRHIMTYYFIGGIFMALFAAIKKTFLRRKTRSFYNSDFILNSKEKQAILIFGFIAVFPIILFLILLIIN